MDEFHRDASNPDLGDPSTRRAVITVPHPSQSNHNGGQLEFGPDGMLYMGTGDGGGGGDPFRTGQNLQDLRGKILRIDPRRNGGEPYAVPANNPFVGQAPWKPEIWAYGVRNPWRFSFDRRDRRLHARRRRPEHLGGDRLPADRRRVGARRQLRLELHGGAAPVRELPRAAEPHACRSTSTTTTSAACSITGGYVGRDQEVPSLLGRYVYADYCSGQIWSNLLAIPDATDNREETDIPHQVANPTSFGEDACGHMYVMGQGGAHERVPDPAAGPAGAVLHRRSTTCPS